MLFHSPYWSPLGKICTLVIGIGVASSLPFFSFFLASALESAIHKQQIDTLAVSLA